MELYGCYILGFISCVVLTYLWKINLFKKIVSFILLLPFVLVIGIPMLTLNMLIKYVAVWQLSEKYKKRHKEYWLGNEFNPAEFVIHLEGDNKIGEMFKR